MCLAIPGKILTKQKIGGTFVAEVDFSGIRRQVCLDFQPEAEVGEFVLVHAGFAISRVNADEAERTYDLLQAMGALEEELAASEEEDTEPH